MNCALIFAGGTGQRMNTKTRPKQFLELHGKPIIIYTIEVFENHPDIDAIVVVCLEDWIPFLRKKLIHYDIAKVIDVVPGGATGQESIRHGIDALMPHAGEDAAVLVHDGVRPLLRPETISDCIRSVQERGSAITVTPAIETITVKTETGEIGQIIERSRVEMARAPQSFYLKDILEVHRKAEKYRLTFIDSASMMRHYGHDLYTVEGSPENIKITTPEDIALAEAILQRREEQP